VVEMMLFVVARCVPLALYPGMLWPVCLYVAPLLPQKAQMAMVLFDVPVSMPCMPTPLFVLTCM
jgi:hypothetical protein